MTVFNKIKHYISLSDMFYATQMLRFKSDTQYKTFTGGVMTIAVIIMVTVGFFNMISQTIHRTAINADYIETRSNDPTYYNLIADPLQNFMFGIEIQPADLSFIIDLANSTRYFDITLGIYHMQYGIPVNSQNLKLVQCTDEHWMQLPSIVEKADLYGYSKWLCPQIGASFPLQGSYVSADNYITQLLVYPCSNGSNPEHPCAPQQQIDLLFNTYQNFYFTINYINTVINPTQPNYLSYYLEGNDCAIFSKTQGSELWFYFADFQIQTDYSIWPFQQTSVDKGALGQGRAVNRPFTVSNYNGYVNAYFSKASNSLNYKRTVQKISAVFSYIGGLVGAISAVLFFLKTYTEMSLEISIAMGIFSTEDERSFNNKQNEDKEKDIINKTNSQRQRSQQSLSFNFLTFSSLLLYKLFKRFKFTKKWKTTQILYNLKEQVVNQLDIKALLRRIISIENCLSCILDEDQILGLKYHQKISFVRAQQLRRLFLLQQEQNMSLNQIYKQNKSKSVKFNFISNNCVANDFSQHQKVIVQNIGSSFQSYGNKNQPILQNENSANGLIKSLSLKKNDQIVENQFNKSQSLSCDSKSDSVSELSEINIKTIRHLTNLKQKSQQNEICRRIWKNVSKRMKQNILQNNKNYDSNNNNGILSTNKKMTSFKIVSDFSIG